MLLATITSPSAAWGQEWRASARIGRVTYDGAPTGASSASSAVLGVGRTAPSSWIGASAALPLNDDPFWAVLGGWQRFSTRGTAGPLLDLSGHGFLQRDPNSSSSTSAPLPGPLSPTPAPSPVTPNLSGEGLGGEAMLGGFVSLASLRLESRAGIAAQRSSLGGVVESRSLPSADAKLSLVRAPIGLQVEARGWFDRDESDAFTGATLRYGRGPLQLWGSLGTWINGGRDGATWSGGVTTALSPALQLELGGRGPTFDPLYRTSAESSVWGGFSLRLGGSHVVRPPVPARAADGEALIRIEAREARGIPSIAGDFTGWKPVPMRREGSHWSWTGRLQPGVYQYAFVGEDGRWFVPASVAGRRDDGMGGQVAVLVVR